MFVVTIGHRICRYISNYDYQHKALLANLTMYESQSVQEVAEGHLNRNFGKVQLKSLNFKLSPKSYRKKLLLLSKKKAFNQNVMFITGNLLRELCEDRKKSHPFI